MPANSIAQFRGYIAGLPAGSKSFAPTDMQNTNAPTAEDQLVLASGDNIFSVPANAKGVLIVFDPTSTTVKTLKGTESDAGIIVSKNGWCVLSFDSPPLTAFVINSGAVDTGKFTSLIYF